jgi:hypothetical protein
MPYPWKIWYADGSTVSHLEREPAAVPGHYGQVIVTRDLRQDSGNVGYLVTAGDYFYYRTDEHRWRPANSIHSVMALLLAREPIVGVIEGMCISDERYKAIEDEAKVWAEQQGWPKKSGYQSDERHR